ncbi:MAG: GPW/gp25 family protein [Mariniphaga sp.]|nr:GPW/gp25 family protein [Mariniphaga sp.]
MEEYKSFLGRGWGFPPEFNKKNKEVGMIENEEDIHSSLEILFSTSLGERIMVPDYGSNLDELLFNPLNLTLITYVIDLIKTAILYYEPRIKIDKIDIAPDNELEGILLISLDYTIRATNSRKNMVFPYYKQEGTDV